MIGIVTVAFFSSSSSSAPEITKDAPSYEEIKKQKQTLTDAQWREYIDTQLINARVTNWTGYILEVNESYLVRIDLEEIGFFSAGEIEFTTSKDVALSLSKNQKVSYSGTIERIEDDFNFVKLILKDVTISGL